MESVLKLIKCEPQPQLIEQSADMWEYDNQVFIYNHLMEDHLFHNVYGADRANGVGAHQEAYPVLVRGAWYWLIGENTPLTDLAVTIPATQVQNAGKPVFPVLRSCLQEYHEMRLLDLVNRREQYGVKKYGQTLMSDDGRDTPTEIVNELIDALAYITKWAMQNPGNTHINYTLRRAIAFTVDIVDIIAQESEDRP